MRFRLGILLAAFVAFAPPAHAQMVESTYSGRIGQTGATAGRIVVAASTNCSVLKASAGILYSVTGWATPNEVNFIRLYNIATTPIATSTTATQIIGLFGGSVAAILPNAIPPTGLAFPQGIGICVTGAGTATDNTAAAGGAIVNYGFK